MNRIEVWENVCNICACGARAYTVEEWNGAEFVQGLHVIGPVKSYLQVRKLRPGDPFYAKAMKRLAKMAESGPQEDAAKALLALSDGGGDS